MKSLDTFLKKHIPDNGQLCTHTRIGNAALNLYGGKYHIPLEDLPEFYKLYHKKVFLNKKDEYLVEKPNPAAFPILVDLDFRYSEDCDERQHTEDHITTIIHIYLEKLHKILQITDNVKFPIFVFEKPDVNTSLPDVTKDGIHIIIGILMDSIQQRMLRDLVLKDIEKVIEDMPVKNTIENIVDISVSRGTQGWQMYGSRKPGNQAYELVRYYKTQWSGGEWDDLDEIEITDFDTLDLMLLVSAQNNTHNTFAIHSNIKEKYEKKKKSINNNIVKKSAPQIQFHQSMDYSKFSKREEIQAAVVAFMETLSMEYYNIKEIYQYVMILPKKYYNNYDNWLQVGFALHNTDLRLFLVWMLFSSQWESFEFSKMEEYYEMWCGMRNDGLTERSIVYWAKENNPSQYKQIYNNTISAYIENSITIPTDHNLAFVLYKMFEGQYVCASIKNKIWYEFRGHKWEEVDSGTTLRNKITRKISNLYNKKIEAMKEKLVSDGEDKSKSLQARIVTAVSISMKMGMVDGKNRIMREAQELFYNKNFFEKLDSNPYLLHFTNGIIDFSVNNPKQLFRDGKPDDYISLSTNHKYIPYNKNDAQQAVIKKEVDGFFGKLFTDASLRRYMKEHLASTLIGTNENETFNIYNGVGRNGKSKLVDLMGKMLGELKGVVPLSLVTRKREGSGKASPELARLRGVRYAVMQEPSKNDRINEGQMKELTGGDAIQARALFRDPIEFKPQFKLAVCTNNLFDVPSNDDGTWRRIRVCEFHSKFCNNPSTNKKDREFQGIIPSKLLAKFDEWLPVFTALLVDIAYKTQGKVKDCEMVMAASNKYRGSQDYLGKFFDEHIIKEEGAELKWTDVWHEFGDWYRNNGYGRDVPKHSEVKNFMEKRLGLYPKRGWKNYRLLGVEELQ